MAVSVPEKTLEHWSSQYINYLYRSYAAQWWPARGEDIRVGWLPNMPGKAVQLELKTTTVAGSGIHDVLVDLGQLWDYHHRPLGYQPFYAFPRPRWRGDLVTAATAGGRQITELAFRRSGVGWWFADWMVLLTTAQVADVLHPELTAHGFPKRGKTATLVRIDLRHSTLTPVLTWGSGTAAQPQVVPWREFWPTLEQCGEVEWPQLIRLPGWLIEAPAPYVPSQVAEMLQNAAYLLAARQWDSGARLVTLEPDMDGNYQIAADRVDDLGVSQADETDEAGDNRQVVFLEARALFRRSR